MFLPSPDVLFLLNQVLLCLQLTSEMDSMCYRLSSLLRKVTVYRLHLHGLLLHETLAFSLTSAHHIAIVFNIFNPLLRC